MHHTLSHNRSSIINIDYHRPTAHGLLNDVVRDSQHGLQGPPGPPGPPGIPGQNQWFSSRENVVDVVEYLKCKRGAFIRFTAGRFGRRHGFQ